MSTVYGCVGAARSRLVEAGIPPAEAASDAEVLARRILGWDKTAYVSHGLVQAPPGFTGRYEAVLTRRAQREPVSLITGHREFWGLDFEVTPDVLTPRPETEILVEAALDHLQASGQIRPHVLDVGTGSGCVAVAIAAEARRARLTASDVSPSALAVARRNATRHGVADRITWIRAPLLKAVAVDDPPDLVVGNLPYIPTADIARLPPEVREFEPHTALDGGADGLETIRRLVDQAPPRLPSGAHLILEIGVDQSEALVRFLADRPAFALVGFRYDLQDIPRVATIRYTPLHLKPNVSP